MSQQGDAFERVVSPDEAADKAELERKEDKRVAKPGFLECAALAKNYQLPFSQVKERLEEFSELDADLSGELSLEEFREAIRNRCGLNMDDPILQQLVEKGWQAADRNQSGLIDFEEFLEWSLTHDYTEEMLDPKEQALRKMARSLGRKLLEVDSVKAKFEKFDDDGNGVLDEDEFRKVVPLLMGLRDIDQSWCSPARLRKFWMEVDTDGNGEITLEEFLTWYFNVHVEEY